MDFIDLLNEFDLTQAVTHPTRIENILDLFLIDNPTLVKSVEVLPCIADHDAVLSEVFIKPQISRQKFRPMSLYKKADWEGLEKHMLAFQRPFLSTCEGRSVNSLWEDFKTALQSGIQQYVPSGLSVLSPHYPGSPKTLSGPCAKGTVCMTSTKNTDALQTDTPTLNISTW